MMRALFPRCGHMGRMLQFATVAVWGLFAYSYVFDRKAHRNALRPNHDRELNNQIRRALDNSRLVSNPHAIQVRSKEGYVTLGGDVFSSEADSVLTFVSSLAGVKGVRNIMHAHQDARGISALQGKPHRARVDLH